MPSKPTETSPRGAFPASSFKYTPFQHLRYLYCRFVQGLFYAAPRGAYHWEEEDAVSEIFISNENVLDGEMVGMRPGISFTRGPVQFFTLGLDDMMGYNAATGQKTKGVLVPGTMSINCCSRNDLESEQIAWIVAEQLWLNRDMLMQVGFFEVGRQPVIGAPSQAGSLVTNDGGREWYATTVTCPFQFYRTGALTPLGQSVVRSIEMSLRTQATPMGNPYESYPSDPSGLPYQVQGARPPSFSPASDVDGYTPNPGFSSPSLDRVPYPLNPAQAVTIRAVHPNQRGIRPPSIYGRAIPISPTSVEESPSIVEVTSTVKV